MQIVIANYFALLSSMIVPFVGYRYFGSSSGSASVIAIFALAFVLLCFVLFSRTRQEHSAPLIQRHLLIHKSVLIVFALAGLLSALQLFLAFQQFRLRLDIEESLGLVLSALWLGTIVLLVFGLASAIHEVVGKRLQSQSPAQSPNSGLSSIENPPASHTAL